MFSTKHLVKPTLLCGPKELSKSFMFEAAIYWAEEGRRVVYITPAPLESLPAACHDRSNPAPAAFKLMRFMYLENYEALIERLVELHTFVTLPSVLLIDDFDAYANDYQKNDVSQDVHISRMCSLILDTMNSCSRILKNSVYVCAWSSTAMNDISTYSIYFRNIWNIKDEEGKTILLQKYSNEGATEKCPSYRYCRLQDGTRILKQILHEPSEN
ncbi:uncharacterized protein LOC114871009 [Osmia bicornis bicornis]|uniref:uncharacterized protein LOC114871009 n=1 Tax=Osmia bicornis bicornis TaxID=1437191 RepID=UPI001EAEF7F4|nr:uncharacterized protein LOC114871009 [Osmia bicornis bicornis]